MQNPPSHYPRTNTSPACLSAYIDSRLTPVERLRVDAHLPHCPSCRGQLASLQATVALLHELPWCLCRVPSTSMPKPTPARSRLVFCSASLARLGLRFPARGNHRCRPFAGRRGLRGRLGVHAHFALPPPRRQPTGAPPRREASPPPGTAMDRTGTLAAGAPAPAAIASPGEAPTAQRRRDAPQSPPTEPPRPARRSPAFRAPTATTPLPGCAQASAPRRWRLRAPRCTRPSGPRAWDRRPCRPRPRLPWPAPTTACDAAG